jgi:hypothetical protein
LLELCGLVAVTVPVSVVAFRFGEPTTLLFLPLLGWPPSGWAISGWC